MREFSTRPLGESLREYGRGVAGGLLFSIPLLYTMEVWWRGVTAEAVIVQVTLEMSGGKSEKSEFQIQFLPRNAIREGWVIFETNPATAERITARPFGYAKP